MGCVTTSCPVTIARKANCTRNTVFILKKACVVNNIIESTIKVHFGIFLGQHTTTPACSTSRVLKLIVQNDWCRYQQIMFACLADVTAFLAFSYCIYYSWFSPSATFLEIGTKIYGSKYCHC